MNSALLSHHSREGSLECGMNSALQNYYKREER